MVVEHGGHIRIGVNGLGASTVKKSAEMSTAEFARLWELAAHNQAAESFCSGIRRFIDESN
jgi:hypothetical protein